MPFTLSAADFRVRAVAQGRHPYAASRYSRRGWMAPFTRICVLQPPAIRLIYHNG